MLYTYTETWRQCINLINNINKWWYRDIWTVLIQRHTNSVETLVMNQNWQIRNNNDDTTIYSRSMMKENNWNIHISNTQTTDGNRPRVLRLRYECDNDKTVVFDCVFIGSNVVMWFLIFTNLKWCRFRYGNDKYLTLF